MAAFADVEMNKTISLDKLARSIGISGSFGTAMIRNGWLLQTDVKYQYKIPKEYNRGITDTDAKRIIEQVRLMNDQSRKTDTGMNADLVEGKTPEIKVNLPDDELSGIKLKSREGANLGSILERALRQSTSVPSLFDESRKDREEVVQIASAIAGGVYREQIGGVWQFSQERVCELNDAIVFAATDLQKRLSGEIKPNRFNPD